ncbi:hypothetical protein [Shimia sp. R9_3]|uniref:hypothetical protein n=1 Tax=Shimia sp. R9_3 TaxID=2821113 RepID=UPI001ADAD36B|nr:hypothetical protein [Shimia sp. R9_3]MBO9400223.1 hypothetical protein [Shimia sp. R9_3]
MIRVSFTKFLDFVAQTGEPKATTALQAWRQSNIPYDPKRDYHRRIRQLLVNYEKTGQEPDWEAFVDSQNPKKQKNFQETIDCYTKWRSKNEVVSWFDPPKEDWSRDEFKLHINPEMGLEIDGERHAIKLFLNNNKLSRLKAQMASLIMHQALSDKSPETRFSIFDI